MNGVAIWFECHGWFATQSTQRSILIRSDSRRFFIDLS